MVRSLPRAILGEVPLIPRRPHGVPQAFMRLSPVANDDGACSLVWSEDEKISKKRQLRSRHGVVRRNVDGDAEVMAREAQRLHLHSQRDFHCAMWAREVLWKRRIHNAISVCFRHTLLFDRATSVI